MLLCYLVLYGSLTSSLKMVVVGVVLEPETTFTQIVCVRPTLLVWCVSYVVFNVDSS